MQDQQIDKAQARALVEKAHRVWILAQVFVFTHENQRVRKQWWFTQLARTTLIASIITVVLSAFGLLQEGSESNESTRRAEMTASEQSDSDESVPRSNRLIWFLTALSAALVAVAKLGEQHIGRPEDIQSHLHTELLLAGKMDSLQLLVARIMGYYDGTHSYDIRELSTQCDSMDVDIGKTGNSVGVVPDRMWEPAAHEAIDGKEIDIALSRVKNPEEVPDNAGGIQAAVRGGVA